MSRFFSSRDLDVVLITTFSVLGPPLLVLVKPPGVERVGRVYPAKSNGFMNLLRDPIGAKIALKVLFDSQCRGHEGKGASEKITKG